MDNPDYDREVAARVGETFTITLQENATTGYRWAIDHFDADALESLESQAKYPQEQRVGARGEATFSFRAKRAGSTDIALKYWRHWEGDKSIIQRYRAHVDVAP